MGTPYPLQTARRPFSFITEERRRATGVVPVLMAGELTEQVIGLAIEVHRQTGPGLLESVYELCLCHELREACIPFERQVAIPLVYKAVLIGEGFKADIVAARAVILEINSVAAILPVHEAQLRTQSADEWAPHQTDPEFPRAPPDRWTPPLHPVAAGRQTAPTPVALRGPPFFLRVKIAWLPKAGFRRPSRHPARASRSMSADGPSNRPRPGPPAIAGSPATAVGRFGRRVSRQLGQVGAGAFDLPGPHALPP